MKVETADYRVQFDSAANLVELVGSLRLRGMEGYEPITAVMEAALKAATTQLTVDLQRLEYLNSSGINVLSRFVIRARERPELTLTIVGTTAVAWQQKSLANLQRFMPTLKLVVHQAAPA